MPGPVALRLVFACVVSLALYAATVSPGLAAPRHVLPPGHEAGLAALLGEGDHLTGHSLTGDHRAGACRFLGAEVTEDRVEARFSGLVVTLVHPDTAPSGALRGGPFTLVPGPAEPRPGCDAGLPQRLARRLAGWTGPSPWRVVDGAVPHPTIARPPPPVGRSAGPLITAAWWLLVAVLLALLARLWWKLARAGDPVDADSREDGCGDDDCGDDGSGPGQLASSPRVAALWLVGLLAAGALASARQYGALDLQVDGDALRDLRHALRIATDGVLPTAGPAVHPLGIRLGPHGWGWLAIPLHVDASAVAILAWTAWWHAATAATLGLLARAMFGPAAALVALAGWLASDAAWGTAGLLTHSNTAPLWATLAVAAMWRWGGSTPRRGGPLWRQSGLIDIFSAALFAAFAVQLHLTTAALLVPLAAIAWTSRPGPSAGRRLSVAFASALAVVLAFGLAWTSALPAFVGLSAPSPPATAAVAGAYAGDAAAWAQAADLLWLQLPSFAGAGALGAVMGWLLAIVGAAAPARLSRVAEAPGAAGGPDPVDAPDRRAVFALRWWLGVALVGAALLAALATPAPRYLVIAAPAFVLAAARGVLVLSRRAAWAGRAARWGPGVAAMVLLAAATLGPGVGRPPAGQRPGLMETDALVERLGAATGLGSDGLVRCVDGAFAGGLPWGEASRTALRFSLATRPIRAEACARRWTLKGSGDPIASLPIAYDRASCSVPLADLPAGWGHPVGGAPLEGPPPLDLRERALTCTAPAAPVGLPVRALTLQALTLPADPASPCVTNVDLNASVQSAGVLSLRIEGCVLEWFSVSAEPSREPDGGP